MSKKIRFRVSPSGEVEVVPSGFSGDECLKATRPFEGLGEKVKESDLPEMWVPQQEKEREGEVL